MVISLLGVPPAAMRSSSAWDLEARCFVKAVMESNARSHVSQRHFPDISPVFSWAWRYLTSRRDAR